MGFDSAFEKTVGHEGGFGIDPKDPGNWTGGKEGVGILKGTKFGICAKQFPDLNIKNLTVADAKAIYRQFYWQVMGLDKVESEPLADEMFDTGVNMGQNRGIIIAQKSLNFFMNNQYIEDGVLGPVTAAGINYWGKRDPEAFFRALNGFQFMRYTDIVKTSDSYFARGWMKRIQDYHEETKALVEPDKESGSTIMSWFKQMLGGK